MIISKAIRMWSVLLALTVLLGAGAASAAHRRGCLKFADFQINWFNGRTGDYQNIFEEEAKTDADSWHNYTDTSFVSIASAGTTDHLNLAE